MEVPKLKKETLTIAKSKTRYQIVLIKGRQSSANDINGLLIWVGCVSDCVETFPVERIFPYNYDSSQIVLYTEQPKISNEIYL